jgi:hypothetical protein
VDEEVVLDEELMLDEVVVELAEQSSKFVLATKFEFD